MTGKNRIMIYGRKMTAPKLSSSKTVEGDVLGGCGPAFPRADALRAVRAGCAVFVLRAASSARAIAAAQASDGLTASSAR